MGSCFSADSRSCSPLPSSPSAANANANSNSNSNSRRRRLGGSSLDDPLHLHPIPGRLFLNGSSPLASLFSQQGKKGANQDAMLLWENFCSGKDAIFCGVFDGHGPFGHMVAKSVRDSLPLNLSSLWQLNGAAQPELNSEEAAFVSADDESRASIDSQEMDKYPPIFLTLKHSFLRAFKVMDTELKMHPSIDCFCSGTTAVTLVKQGLDLVIANVGDSRAVLATRDKDNSLTPVQLTVDLKPSLPAEADRIRKCKGRVFALQDEPEVARVWLPNNDSPGLAMARAFGDFCLKDFGLISVPEISYWRLTEKDEFVVLATDGIWDVLSNKEVVDIIATSPTRSSAARVLVESAVRAWRYKYPTSKVDDCAVVCLFLDSDSPKLSSTSHLDAKEKLSLADQINPEGVLDRSVTCRASNENSREGSNEEASKEIDAELEKEWSALEGVSRVNTLLNLPRFVPDEDVDKAMAGMRKIR